MTKKKTKMLELYDLGGKVEVETTPECDAVFGKWTEELIDQVAWAYISTNESRKDKGTQAGTEPLCMVDLRQKDGGEVSAYISYRNRIAELSDGPMGPFDAYAEDIRKATQKLLKRLEGK